METSPIVFPHPPRCVKRSYPVGNRIQQFQQQIDTWQVLLEKLGGKGDRLIIINGNTFARQAATAIHQ